MANNLIDMDSLTTQHIATTAKWGGATVSAGGVLSVNEYLAVGGFVVALIGTIANFLLNYYYKRAENNRRRELHEAMMRKEIPPY